MTPSEFTVSTRDYISDYIKFADAKAGAVMTITVALGAVAGFAANEFFAAVRAASDVWFAAATIIAAVGAACAAMTVWFCIEALAPNTTAAQNSLASFPDIAKMDAVAYKSAVVALDSAAAAAEFASLNTTLAAIASLKFGNVRTAVLWLRGLLFSIYAMVLVYVARVALGAA